DRGHRRVGGVAAGAQRLDGGEAREGVRGGGHALAGDDRRAARQLKIAAHIDTSVPIPKFAGPCGAPLMRTSGSGTLVSRFRSSQALVAHFHANFGIKGTLATL